MRSTVETKFGALSGRWGWGVLIQSSSNFVRLPNTWTRYVCNVSFDFGMHSQAAIGVFS